jgi:putative membrane protein
MKTVLLLIAAVTLASAGAAAQQPNNPQPNAAQQTQQQQNAQALTPQEFVQKAQSGTNYEIGASQLAVRKAHDFMIRRLAYRMIRDHARIGAALTETIAADRAVDLPADTPMTSDQTQKIGALKSASGQDFDNTYVQQMVDDHKQALPMFENYARDGSDARLKVFARRTVPLIRVHLLMAERLQKLESQATTPIPTTGRSSSQDRSGGQTSAPAAGKPIAPANPAGSGGGAGPVQAPAPAAPSDPTR